MSSENINEQNKIYRDYTNEISQQIALNVHNITTRENIYKQQYEKFLLDQSDLQCNIDKASLQSANNAKITEQQDATNEQLIIRETNLRRHDIQITKKETQYVKDMQELIAERKELDLQNMNLVAQYDKLRGERKEFTALCLEKCTDMQKRENALLNNELAKAQVAESLELQRKTYEIKKCSANKKLSNYKCKTDINNRIFTSYE